MQLLLGIIIGLVIATMVFAILAFFRAGIEKRVRIIETKLGSAGPQTKGAIFIPEDEAEIARREHIKRNNEIGRDTPISELL